jgi:prepilin-type N-terminal cleavage/methylation domain-containing protein
MIQTSVFLGGCFAAPPASPSRRRGLTLIELLITMTIIALLAGIILAALQGARESARRAKTKATIAKLHALIMQKYESYMTRRVPLTVNTGTMAPNAAAQTRLAALRDLMRMEMPERWEDISDPPYAFSWGSVPEPSVHKAYQQRYQPGSQPAPNAKFALAKCLYLTLTTGNAEAREQFGQDEIMVDSDGFAMFKDGWGNPISWLRWAPGCSPTNPYGFSEIQSGDATKDHDPFDTQNVDSTAYHLIPLIFTGFTIGSGTAAGMTDYGVNVGNNVHFTGASPCTDGAYKTNGQLYTTSAITGSQLTNVFPQVHNHHVD